MDSGLVGLGDPVLLGVGQDYVHVLVEGEEGADHHPPVLDGDPNPEVDPLQELASLSRHFIIDSQFYNIPPTHLLPFSEGFLKSQNMAFTLGIDNKIMKESFRD